MPRQRITARLAAQWLLACFALVLLASGIAPLARAVPSMERVCSASGEARWIAVGDHNGSGATGALAYAHGLDCALCLPTLAAPDVPASGAQAAAAPAPCMQTGHSLEHTLALSRPLFPPRAPPCGDASLALT